MLQALKLHLYQQWTWKRLLPIVFYLTLYSLMIIMPYRQLAEQYQESYSLGILAILMTSYWYVAVVMVGVIFLFNQLPFRNNFQYWLVLKMGYGPWLISQVLYIIVTSTVFVLANTCLTWGLLLPYLNGRFDNWGRLLNALAQDWIQLQEPIQGKFNEVALQYYSVPQALIQTLFLFWLLVILLGLIILVFNQMGLNLGLAAACGLVMESVYFSYASRNWIQFLSPLNWLSIYQVKYEPHSGIPTLENVCLRIALLYIVLLGIMYYRVKTRKVRVK